MAIPGNKTALITGATGGFGSATAIALAKEGGWDLALQFNSATVAVRDALSEKIVATRKGPKGQCRISFYMADMGDYGNVRKLYKEVAGDFGGVDVLFNNAGASGGLSGVQGLNDVPFEVFETTWRINTGSAILLTQLCLPYMEEQGWGRIVFCSSVAAFTGGFVGPHYASSKSAQHGFVHWLANNVAKKGITVNGIAPAMVGGTSMMDANQDEEVKKRIESRESFHVGWLMRWMLTLVIQAYRSGG